jgi:hypothetical protein
MLGRWMRRRFSRDGKGDSTAEKRQRGAAGTMPVGGFILSIVPGLGHAAKGRFRDVRIVWILWLVLFLMTVVCFATPWGWIALGVAAACHAYIALRVELLDYLDELGARLLAILLTTSVLLVIYGTLPFWLLNLRFIRIPFDIPAYRVRTGDLLMFRPYDGSTADLPSGTIILSDATEIRMADGRRLQVVAGARRSVGQVVGRAHETVALSPEGMTQFYVQGEPLDPNRIPVPRWLQAVEWREAVPDDHYFISHVFRFYGRQANTTDLMVNSACLIPVERVHRRAVMVWWPLHRRQRLP